MTIDLNTGINHPVHTSIDPEDVPSITHSESASSRVDNVPDDIKAPSTSLLARCVNFVNSFPSLTHLSSFAFLYSTISVYALLAEFEATFVENAEASNYSEGIITQSGCLLSPSDVRSSFVRCWVAGVFQLTINIVPTLVLNLAYNPAKPIQVSYSNQSSTSLWLASSIANTITSSLINVLGYNYVLIYGPVDGIDSSASSDNCLFRYADYFINKSQCPYCEDNKEAYLFYNYLAFASAIILLILSSLQSYGVMLNNQNPQRSNN